MKRVFPDFDRYVCEGDTVTLDIDGFTLTATLYSDDGSDGSDAPDERDDGFWPSLDPDDAGYIGNKSKSTLARHLARAKQVMQAWKDDEWFYCGVAVTVEREGVQLTGRYDHALWGIECNYPERNKRHRPNDYLAQVASEYIGEVLDAARAKIAALCEGV